MQPKSVAKIGSGKVTQQKNHWIVRMFGFDEFTKGQNCVLSFVLLKLLCAVYLFSAASFQSPFLPEKCWLPLSAGSLVGPFSRSCKIVYCGISCLADKGYCRCWSYQCRPRIKGKGRKSPTKRVCLGTEANHFLLISCICCTTLGS